MKKTIKTIAALCIVLALCAGCSATGSGSDVTATITKGVSFSLTDSISDTIKSLNKKGIQVVDARFSRLYGTYESGEIYYGKESLDLSGTAPIMAITLDPVPNEASASMGYLRFIFLDGKFPCESLSLLKGWNGEVEKVDSFMTEENSFTEGNNIYSVFKNGKLIPAKEIMDKYGDKASKTAEFSSISDYLESEGLSFYKNDEINIVPGFFISMGSGQTSECTDKYFAVYFALLDLATEYQNGTIDNFGLLTKDSRGYIDISIACSLDNYMALKKAEHYIEQ